MTTTNRIINWLLAGDPAIRWQTYRDLLNADRELISCEQQLVAVDGWGARLLALQEQSGQWGGGLYSPKWTSTTYTMLLLRQLGLPSAHPQARKACRLLLEQGLYHDGGINFFTSWKCSEICITGMVLSILAYFHYEDDKITQLVEYLLAHQMKDGGWNCQVIRGATHSSFHTTILVLEGLREYEKSRAEVNPQIKMAQQQAHEFLLVHRLIKSHRTGKVVNAAMTRFSFPPYWHYDLIRALDYFQELNVDYDERFADGIKILLQRRIKDGCWLLQNKYPGRTFFDLEKIGRPSRWNTLRALRILRWWEKKAPRDKRTANERFFYAN